MPDFKGGGREEECNKTVVKVRVLELDYLRSNPGFFPTFCVTLGHLPNFLDFSFLICKMGTAVHTMPDAWLGHRTGHYY